jgi:hypothetical protein
MIRYPFIGFVDELSSLIHRMAAPVAARASQTIPERPGASDPWVVYRLVFAVCKEALRPRTEGFRMCGCGRHCPLSSARSTTALRCPSGVKGRGTTGGAPRLRRCVIRLDVPLREFMQDIETPILRSVAAHAGAWSWRRRPFPPVRDVVVSALGRRGQAPPCPAPPERLCESGACFDFDPWDRVEPPVGFHPTVG